MKNKQYINKILLVLALIAVSCTDGFEEINKDPNAFNEAPASSAFAGVVKETLDLVGGEINERWAIHWAAYTGGTGGQNAKYGFTGGTLAGIWSDMFVKVLKNNEEIILAHLEDPEYANRVQIAKIWKSYVYSVGVAIWGPLPMSEAFGLESTVNYDSEEQIYTEILSMLETAASTIDPAGDSYSADHVFGGDNNKWIKFANTLRLKIALRISHGFPALAESHARAVMSNEAGLISSSGEEANLQWGTEEENWGRFYERFIFGQVNDDSYLFVNHNFLLHLKTYRDPRMDALVEDASEPVLIEDMVYASGSTTEMIPVRYGIPKYGRPMSNSTLDGWDLNGNDNPMQDVNNGFYSRPSYDHFFIPDATFNIITLAEVNLMKAEAAHRGWGGSSSAEEYYYAGIDASFAYYGVSGADAYKEREGIKWNTAAAGDRDLWGITNSGISADGLDKIVRQRWIAMYWQGVDGWALRKRTRSIVLPPHTAHDGVINVTTDYAEIPERMEWDKAEVAINPGGFASGISHLGGPDETVTPLKMNKPSPGTDWESKEAEYNSDFGRHWYGDSEDDLIEAGIPYEKL
jgi:hypothetical protein